MIRLPTLKGVIDRRILVNFTADPADVQKILPSTFRPQLIQGKAIVGICLIRLKQIRPKGLPAFMGIGSENGAHRIAVEWERNGNINHGVYIPRRDTSLGFNALVGGRLFPGKHHHAAFNVQEADGHYRISFTAKDETHLLIDAENAQDFPSDSVFSSLDEASAFFKGGDAGYSPNGSKLDGMLLDARNWSVSPLEMREVESSFFDDKTFFQPGSVKFDNALLMREVHHEWRSLPDL